MWDRIMRPGRYSDLDVSDNGFKHNMQQTAFDLADIHKLNSLTQVWLYIGSWDDTGI
jgi:hypothetical protein